MLTNNIQLYSYLRFLHALRGYNNFLYFRVNLCGKKKKK